MAWQYYLTFSLTFITYSLVHASRSVYSISKSRIQESFQISNAYLGIIDSSFLLCYALSTKTLSMYADSLPLKTLILLSIFVMTLMLLFIPFANYFVFVVGMAFFGMS